MFNYLSGKLIVKDPTYVVIDVGGVGYEVKISLGTFSKIKGLEHGKLFTYFHVKEDMQVLFGFVDTEEKELFIKLISISGIGPSTALMMFSSLSKEELIDAISSGNVKTIQSVKGIGAKTAQRVILELKDKVSKTEVSIEGIPGIAVSPSQEILQEAVAALVTLGIAKNVAEKNVRLILKRTNSQLSLEEIIKLALKSN
ncbi:MAG: Holliday junction branch migration protein RuvA [Flammeovirgaceae bacterium]|nr:Holliday junction branch migration protein RuvA [Flammeovirgaceae bacterium]